MTEAPHHLIVGPAQHGVTRYALLLAAAAVSAGRTTRVASALTPADVAGLAVSLPTGQVHVHVTDHLLGTSPEAAAEAVHRLAQDRSLSLTLHDLPQPSDGAVAPRRARAYADMACAAVGVVVSSEYERGLLAVALDGRPARVGVVPHAVMPPASLTPVSPQSPPDVAVLGFVYPGKGHIETLDAVAALPGDVGVVALGRASTGHEWLVDLIGDRARGLGRRFSVSGWLDDEVLAARLRLAAVPVAPHQHVSASGSIATWLSVGRRPLVTASAYTAELAARLPGALTLAGPTVDELSAAIRAALADPASTWLSPTVAITPTPAEAATATEELVSIWAAEKGEQRHQPRQADQTKSVPKRLVPRIFADGPQPATLAISVVIPYFDAQHTLDLVLAGLDLQTLPADRFEVVVADDGSPLPPQLGEHPFGIRTVRQPDQGFRAAAARNLGAAAASGEVLCFLDGDTVPEPGYLAAVLAEVLAAVETAGQGRREAVVVGRRRHADLTGWGPDAVRAWLAGGSSAARPRELDEPSWLREAYALTRDLQDADDESYRYVISAVMSMPRSLFEAVGGFDDRFRAYGGEDWELANRCWLAGADLCHQPRAVAWHDGPDFAGRGVDQRAVQDAQALVLARLLPSPAGRPPGLVWQYPLVVAEVDDRGWTAAEAMLCVAALVAGTDAGVWLVEGRACTAGGPLAEDPRVHVGAPPADVVARCRYRAFVDAPIELDAPLSDLCRRAPLRGPGLHLRHARDLATGARLRPGPVGTRLVDLSGGTAAALRRASAERAQEDHVT